MKRLIDRITLASGYLNPIVLASDRRFDVRCIRRVAPSVLVCHEYEFVYCRVPKSANTTMLNLLYESIEGKGIKAWDRNNLTRRYFSSLGGRTLLKANVPLNNYFFFTVVRNPYDRILSAYLDKFSMPEYRGRYPSVYHPKYKVNPAENYNSFLKHLVSSRQFMFSDHHWVPQYLFLLPSLDRIDYVGKVESLTFDYSDIAKRLKLPFLKKIDSSFRGQGVSTTSSTEKRDVFYSEDIFGRENKKIVSELYERDFIDFGYEF
ncbi:sulfotransferase family protein [Aestuariicella sp. G3-2]|uniref:sulfotransferase family protein n=1 Tax=Pseudomaricurvus albidus TaxID=2842452 RepID=UPI001C0B62C5|nr:sulfotransferase family protein [Aestuariicella albida]MBU3071677.1 sulfotransferase family protein [Aestuariicella albida]